MRRLPENTLDFGGLREPKATYSSDTIPGYHRQKFRHTPPKERTHLRAVMQKNAYPSCAIVLSTGVMLWCCDAAVGRDHQRPPSGLKCHRVSHVTCVIWLQQVRYWAETSNNYNESAFDWPRPLAAWKYTPYYTCNGSNFSSWNEKTGIGKNEDLRPRVNRNKISNYYSK